MNLQISDDAREVVYPAGHGLASRDAWCGGCDAGAGCTRRGGHLAELEVTRDR